MEMVVKPRGREEGAEGAGFTTISAIDLFA
jgi:hypothetical protein